MLKTEFRENVVGCLAMWSLKRVEACGGGLLFNLQDAFLYFCVNQFVNHDRSMDRGIYFGDKGILPLIWTHTQNLHPFLILMTV